MGWVFIFGNFNAGGEMRDLTIPKGNENLSLGEDQLESYDGIDLNLVEICSQMLLDAKEIESLKEQYKEAHAANLIKQIFSIYIMREIIQPAFVKQGRIKNKRDQKKIELKENYEKAVKALEDENGKQVLEFKSKINQAVASGDFPKVSELAEEAKTLNNKFLENKLNAKKDYDLSVNELDSVCKRECETEQSRILLRKKELTQEEKIKKLQKLSHRSVQFEEIILSENGLVSTKINGLQIQAKSLADRLSFSIGNTKRIKGKQTFFQACDLEDTKEMLEAEQESEELSEDVVDDFFTAVVRGDLAKIKEKIKVNELLVRKKMTGRDLSDREFLGTGFQYALLVKDIPMCNFFLEVLSEREIKFQFEDFNNRLKKDLFSFDEVLESYEYYIKNYSVSKDRTSLYEKLSSAQSRFPAWVVYLCNEPKPYSCDIAWFKDDSSFDHKRESSEQWKTFYTATKMGSIWLRGCSTASFFNSSTRVDPNSFTKGYYNGGQLHHDKNRFCTLKKYVEKEYSALLIKIGGIALKHSKDCNTRHDRETPAPK